MFETRDYMTNDARHTAATILSRMRARIDQAGGHFTAGLVLHTGQRRLSFGDRLLTLPASDLRS